MIVGTGKYPDYASMQQALDISGTEVVTVAVRRERLIDKEGKSLLDFIDTKRYTILPNTAGCFTADDAVRVARLGREILDQLDNPGKDWVKLRPEDLVGATDPLSAGLVRASSPDEVCGRTLKLYDGEFRLDVRLQPVSDPPQVEGYGDVVLCRAKPKPVAGYRKGRRALDYLENKSRIMIAFAPLATTGFYAPVYATVGTQIGTVTVRATHMARPG